MKKLFLGITAGVLAAAMCVGFAACGKDVDPATFKSEEVTAEEWAEALKEENFENIKVTAKVEQESARGEESGKMTTNMTLICADGKEHVSGTVKYEGTAIEKDDEGNDVTEDKAEIYYENTDTAVYEYEKNDEGVWEKREVSHGTADETIALFTMFADAYDAFEYNAEKNGYTVKTEGIPEDLEYVKFYSNFILKFKDAKLAAIYMETNNSGGEGENAYSYKLVYSYAITYGGQKVTLPEAVEPQE